MNNKRSEVLYHPHHKLGYSFCGHKYFISRLVVAISNFSKITCTFQMVGNVIVKCDFFPTLIFANTKKYEVHPWRLF